MMNEECKMMNEECKMKNEECKNEECIEGADCTAPSPCKIANSFVPPSRDAVLSYANERGDDPSEVDLFMVHYANTGWAQKNGKKIKSWKRTWAEWIARSKKFKLQASRSRNADDVRMRLDVKAESDTEFKNTIL